MKVCALSPFCSSSKADILDFIGKATHSLIVLPGACDNTPSPQEIQRILRRHTRVFVETKRHGKEVLKGKAKNVPYMVTRDKILKMPCQVFGAHPSARQMDQLATAWQKRTFTIGSRQVTLVICGEISAFNPDGTVKHGRSLPYDILANPAHTTMGRWNHLGKKLAQLSKATIVLHTSNNTRNHHRLTTDVRIYKDHKMLIKRRAEGTLAWIVCDT